MQLTGHKNVQSINNYSTIPMDKQKTMSNTLSNIVSPVRQMDAPSTSSASIQELGASLTDDTDLNESCKPSAVQKILLQKINPSIQILVTYQGFNLLSSEAWKTNPLSMFHSATIMGI